MYTVSSLTRALTGDTIDYIDIVHDSDRAQRTIE